MIKASVRAAASEGEANEALVKLIANALGVAARDVRLVTGTSARIKHLKIVGAGAVLAAALEKIFAME